MLSKHINGVFLRDTRIDNLLQVAQEILKSSLRLAALTDKFDNALGVAFDNLFDFESPVPPIEPVTNFFNHARVNLISPIFKFKTELQIFLFVIAVVAGIFAAVHNNFIALAVCFDLLNNDIQAFVVGAHGVKDLPNFFESAGI